MKIILFGATGSIGKYILRHPIASEHAVSAFVRNPDKLDLDAANLTVRVGNVLNYESVLEATRGHDAVLSALGAPALSRSTVRSEGTRNIVRAMESLGIERLVCLSTIGIGDSKRLLPGRYRYLLVPLLLKRGFADHELQEAIVKRSKTKWTIIRPGEYVDGNGMYRHNHAIPDTPVRARTPRAAVADFMLRQLSDDSYLHKTPWVSI